MARAQLFNLVIAPLTLFVLSGYAAQGDNQLPPLNAQETRQSTPVTVGGTTFTTGFYSWWVERYRIDEWHRSDSVRVGPWEWAAVVGLGGEEPIGPRVSTNAAHDYSRCAAAKIPVSIGAGAAYGEAWHS